MRTVSRTCTVTLLLLAALLLTATTLADGGYDLSWWTADGGGATFSAGGDFAMGGTVGQPEAGSLSGGGYNLTGGFWSGTGPQPFAFLPVVMK